MLEHAEIRVTHGRNIRHKTVSGTVLRSLSGRVTLPEAICLARSENAICKVVLKTPRGGFGVQREIRVPDGLMGGYFVLSPTRLSGESRSWFIKSLEGRDENNVVYVCHQGVPGGQADTQNTNLARSVARFILNRDHREWSVTATNIDLLLHQVSKDDLCWEARSAAPPRLPCLLHPDVCVLARIVGILRDLHADEVLSFGLQKFRDVAQTFMEDKAMSRCSFADGVMREVFCS